MPSNRSSWSMRRRRVGVRRGERDRRRQRLPGGDRQRSSGCRASSVSGGWTGSAPGTNSATVPVTWTQRCPPTAAGGRRRAGEDEDALRGLRVGVDLGVRRLEEEAVDLSAGDDAARRHRRRRPAATRRRRPGCRGSASACTSSLRIVPTPWSSATVGADDVGDVDEERLVRLDRRCRRLTLTSNGRRRWPVGDRLAGQRVRDVVVVGDVSPCRRPWRCRRSRRRRRPARSA